MPQTLATEPSTASVVDENPGTDDVTSGEPPRKFPRIDRPPVPEGMSRKQWKRMQKSEGFQERRLQKRADEKERRKAKRAQLKAEGRGGELAKKKVYKMANSQCKVRVAVDMSFDDRMNDKDQKRTVLQLAWGYSANRRYPNPIQYHIVGFNGPCKKYFAETYTKWDVNLHEESLDETFKTEEIVYLTADSDNVLDKLDDSKVYVIGGIIDHNSEKFLCHKIATERGYGHARLPIDEFVNMKTRKVLTINHVFEILLKYTECGDWEKAFFHVIPQRKGVQKKDDDDDKKETTTAEEEEAEKENSDDDERKPDVESGDSECEKEE